MKCWLERWVNAWLVLKFYCSYWNPTFLVGLYFQVDVHLFLFCARGPYLKNLALGLEDLGLRFLLYCFMFWRIVALKKILVLLTICLASFVPVSPTESTRKEVIQTYVHPHFFRFWDKNWSFHAALFLTSATTAVPNIHHSDTLFVIMNLIYRWERLA